MEEVMTRSAYFVACATVFCCATAATQAVADPVTITSGSIVLSEPNQFQAGPIALTGTRGFSITGSVITGDGVIDPLRQCFPCESTTNFSVGADLATFGISGAVTLDGQTYSDINEMFSANFVRLRLIGTTVLPPVNGSSLVIRAPFTLSEPASSFTYEITPGSGELTTVALGGRGTATVSFHVNPTTPVWEFSQMRYDFVATPEPSTLILVGGGLAAVLRARARRRS